MTKIILLIAAAGAIAVPAHAQSPAIEIDLQVGAKRYQSGRRT